MQFDADSTIMAVGMRHLYKHADWLQTRHRQTCPKYTALCSSSYKTLAQLPAETEQKWNVAGFHPLSVCCARMTWFENFPAAMVRVMDGSSKRQPSELADSSKGRRRAGINKRNNFFPAQRRNVIMAAQDRWIFESFPVSCNDLLSNESRTMDCVVHWRKKKRQRLADAHNKRFVRNRVDARFPREDKIDGLGFNGNEQILCRRWIFYWMCYAWCHANEQKLYCFLAFLLQ